MLIRKYRAKSFQDALVQIKSELGDDATILSTERVRSGLWGSQFEVTALLGNNSPKSATPQITEYVAPFPPAPPKQGLSPLSSLGEKMIPPPLEISQIARFLAPIRNELQTLQLGVKSLNEKTKQT